MNGELVGSKTLDDTGRPRHGLHGARRAACGRSTSWSSCSAPSHPTACPAPPRAPHRSRSTSTPQASTLDRDAGDAGDARLPAVAAGAPGQPAGGGPHRGRAALRRRPGRRPGSSARCSRPRASPSTSSWSPADAFIADDRSGVVIGATTRRRDQPRGAAQALRRSGCSTRPTRPSRSPRRSRTPSWRRSAASDSVDRQVLMLGGWSPGDESAPRALTDKLVDFLVSARLVRARRRPADHRRLRPAVHRRQHDAGPGGDEPGPEPRSARTPSGSSPASRCCCCCWPSRW